MYILWIGDRIQTGIEKWWLLWIGVIRREVRIHGGFLKPKGWSWWQSEAVRLWMNGRYAVLNYTTSSIVKKKEVKKVSTHPSSILQLSAKIFCWGCGFDNWVLNHVKFMRCFYTYYSVIFLLLMGVLLRVWWFHLVIPKRCDPLYHQLIVKYHKARIETKFMCKSKDQNHKKYVMLSKLNFVLKWGLKTYFNLVLILVKWEREIRCWILT